MDPAEKARKAHEVATDPPPTYYIDYKSSGTSPVESKVANLHSRWESVNQPEDGVSRLVFVTIRPDEDKDDDDKNHYGLCTNECKPHFKEKWHLPEYLFSDTCLQSNGYVREFFSGDERVQHFRCLVKQLNKDYQKKPLIKYKKKTYQWYEMTFCIRSKNDGPISVVGFGVPPDFHSIFATALETIADDTRWTLDSERVMAVLLQEIVSLYDKSVWGNSNAVRAIEKLRDKNRYSSSSGYDFPALHELHRHIIHTTEVIEVVLNSLKKLSEVRLAKERAIQAQATLQIVNTANATVTPLPQSTGTATSISNPRPSPLSGHMKEHYDFCSQLLQSFTLRSQANVSRLQNEITFASGSATIDLGLTAQRDAAAMRKIAFVTLLFLPATFVATLFGMTFYNYEAGGKWSTSEDIWRFWAIAAPLTFGTAIFWWSSQLFEQRWWPKMKYWPGISKKAWRWRLWRRERTEKKEDDRAKRKADLEKEEEIWNNDRKEKINHAKNRKGKGVSQQGAILPIANKGNP